MDDLLPALYYAGCTAINRYTVKPALTLPTCVEKRFLSVFTDLQLVKTPTAESIIRKLYALQAILGRFENTLISASIC